MADRYRSFAGLAAHEKEDLDFQIRSDERPLRLLLSRHTEAELSLVHRNSQRRSPATIYLSIRLKDLRKENGVLHITSSRFDEPNALALVAASPAAVALHGELDCPDQVVFLGGLDKELGKRIQAGLEAAGFVVRIHDDPNLQGVDKNNICNRGRSGQGVTTELSQPLRDSFFPSFDRRGREKRTQQGDKFVDAMRKAILGGKAGAASKADKINES